MVHFKRIEYSVYLREQCNCKRATPRLHLGTAPAVIAMYGCDGQLLSVLRKKELENAYYVQTPICTSSPRQEGMHRKLLSLLALESYTRQ